MIQYWTRLNDRERWMVVLTGVFLLLFLLYSFLYSPIITITEEKEKALQDKAETAIWLQNVKKTALISASGQKIGASKLLSLIATQLSVPPFSKFPHQIQQTSQGSIQLSFDKVPYSAFMTWLWKLENSYLITIEKFDSSRSEKSGVIKTMVLINANA